MRKTVAALVTSALLTGGLAAAAAPAAAAPRTNVPCASGYELKPNVRHVYGERVIYSAAEKRMISERRIVKTEVVSYSCKKPRWWWPF